VSLAKAAERLEPPQSLPASPRSRNVWFEPPAEPCSRRLDSKSWDVRGDEPAAVGRSLRRRRVRFAVEMKAGGSGCAIQRPRRAGPASPSARSRWCATGMQRRRDVEQRDDGTTDQVRSPAPIWGHHTLTHAAFHTRNARHAKNPQPGEGTTPAIASNGPRRSANSDRTVERSSVLVGRHSATHLDTQLGL